MDTLGHETRNYQCIKCGEIHSVEINKVYNLDDDIYYATYCPCCKEVVKHLDVGIDKNEIYELYDVVLDSKYY
jgi:hypothetical protein